MTSFMGPMAPPPPAQPQPQAMDFQTDPNNRQRFRQFLNNRMQPPMMQQPSMMQAPMMQPPAHMPPILPEIDIFAPQGYADGGIVGFSNGGSTQPIEQRVMKNGQIGLFRGQTFLGFKQGSEEEKEPPLLSLAKFKEVLGLEDGGAVPPRRADIRGQDHMLSYITPDEADILKALGGSGEAGPMGIPSFPEPGMGGDQDSRGGSGNEAGVGGGMGEGQGGDGYGGGGGSSDNSDDASDDDMGDVGVMDGPGYSGPDDTDSTEVATDQESMGFDVFDSIDDFNQQQQEQAQRDRAIRDAFVTDRTGKPIGTRSGYVTQGRATDAELSAGYKALGLPDPNSDLASADVEASYGVPAGIASVTGAPADSLSSSKKGLLGFDYDLLNANIDKAIEARKGMPTQVSPLATSPFNARNQAAAPVSAPSSNVVDNFSMTPADQLADVYGIDIDALNASVDDDFAAIGARGPSATDSRAGVGYNPDTDMPFGLEFATNPQTGAQITTNLAGLTEQQQRDQPLSMDIAQAIGSNPYGYEIDPQTGQVIGQVGTPPFGILGGLTTLAQDLFMGPPQTTQDLIERGVYTGMTGQDDDGGFGGGDGPERPVAKVDPCPPGFSLVNGTCTPVSDSGSGDIIGPIEPPLPVAPAPVIVPSPRQPMPFLGQMPSGYGTPVTGGVNPQVMSEMQKYAQLLSRPQPQYPVGLANGGSVSSNLDMAADNFLKALMPAA